MATVVKLSSRQKQARADLMAYFRQHERLFKPLLTAEVKEDIADGTYIDFVDFLMTRYFYTDTFLTAADQGRHNELITRIKP